MFSQKSQISTKELSCHLCGKLTPLYQVKAYNESHWICSGCADRVFHRTIKKPLEESREQKKEIPQMTFDPFGEGNKSTDRSPASSLYVKQLEKSTIFSRREEMRKASKKRGEKHVYKCTHCTFESRHYNENEICPNCGRYNTLVRIPLAADIVDEVKRNRFL